jgi:hypothetical protein
MPGILEVVFVTLFEAIPIDRLLFGGSPEESAIENCSLTASFRWGYKTRFSF